jgi:hypothetical protein
MGGPSKAPLVAWPSSPPGHADKAFVLNFARRGAGRKGEAFPQSGAAEPRLSPVFTQALEACARVFIPSSTPTGRDLPNVELPGAVATGWTWLWHHFTRLGFHLTRIA